MCVNSQEDGVMRKVCCLIAAMGLAVGSCLADTITVTTTQDSPAMMQAMSVCYGGDSAGYFTSPVYPPSSGGVSPKNTLMKFTPTTSGTLTGVYCVYVNYPKGKTSSQCFWPVQQNNTLNWSGGTCQE